MTETQTAATRPLRFSGPVVGAILDGRKTTTRRVVKNQPQPDGGKGLHPVRPYRRPDGQWTWVLDGTGVGGDTVFRCPYGVPGDRFYVSERVEIVATDAVSTVLEYRGGERRKVEIPTRIKYPTVGVYRGRVIPREWARAKGVLAGVRVERLQEITPEDIRAEGVRRCVKMDGFGGLRFRSITPCGLDPRSYGPWISLWDSLNARRGYGWDANPFVWVLTFRKLDLTI